MSSDLFILSLHLADNALILGQRNSEWTGHGPVLEQDIAITNISLDYLGQARNFYQHAAQVYNEASESDKQAFEAYLPRLWKGFGRELQEDDLAFLRDEHQFTNLLLTELPKGDWAVTILRQFFFSAFQLLQYQQLQQSNDLALAAIAEKSIKEVAYHLRWSSEWVIRLGDGTPESNSRINKALTELWPFTGELFIPAGFEERAYKQILAKEAEDVKTSWLARVATVFEEAGLQVPVEVWAQAGGKRGHHTEYMGYLLAEMQQLQRTYPNAEW